MLERLFDFRNGLGGDLLEEVGGVVDHPEVAIGVDSDALGVDEVIGLETAEGAAVVSLAGGDSNSCGCVGGDAGALQRATEVCGAGEPEVAGSVQSDIGGVGRAAGLTVEADVAAVGGLDAGGEAVIGDPDAVESGIVLEGDAAIGDLARWAVEGVAVGIDAL